jgi:DNA-damage-inducible protein J
MSDPTLPLPHAFGQLLPFRVAAEKALPFEPLNPNPETVAATKAVRRGELIKVGKSISNKACRSDGTDLKRLRFGPRDDGRFTLVPAKSFLLEDA